MDTFRFWMPLQKSLELSPSGDRNRILEGVASTENLDQQGERMIQKGIDFTPLLERGFIDWNHQAHSNPDAILGVPLEANIHTIRGAPCLYIKAMLYQDNGGMADKTWERIASIEKANADGYPMRKIGWSVEGAVLARDRGDLLRSEVRMCALTHEPVNIDTFASIAKSMVQMSKTMTTTTPLGISSIGSVSPITLQNLAGSGPIPIATVVQTLWGGCNMGHMDQDGEFVKGRMGMFDHLVHCKGVQPHDAKSLVFRLYKTLGT